MEIKASIPSVKIVRLFAVALPINEILNIEIDRWQRLLAAIRFIVFTPDAYRAGQ